MLKIRVTFVNSEKGKLELDNFIKSIKKNYNILNQSEQYKGRGNSSYNNVYLDVEDK